MAPTRSDPKRAAAPTIRYSSGCGMPVSEIYARNVADAVGCLPGRQRAVDRRLAHPVGGRERAGLDVCDRSQARIQPGKQRTRRDDRQVVLQVDLVDLGREQLRHDGRRGGVSAGRQQRGPGGAGGVSSP